MAIKDEERINEVFEEAEEKGLDTGDIIQGGITEEEAREVREAGEDDSGDGGGVGRSVTGVTKDPETGEETRIDPDVERTAPDQEIDSGGGGSPRQAQGEAGEIQDIEVPDRSELAENIDQTKPETVAVETGVTREQVRSGDAGIIERRDIAREQRLNIEEQREFIQEQEPGTQFQTGTGETLTRQEALRQTEQSLQQATRNEQIIQQRLEQDSADIFRQAQIRNRRRRRRQRTRNPIEGSIGEFLDPTQRVGAGETRRPPRFSEELILTGIDIQQQGQELGREIQETFPDRSFARQARIPAGLEEITRGRPVQALETQLPGIQTDLERRRSRDIQRGIGQATTEVPALIVGGGGSVLRTGEQVSEEGLEAGAATFAAGGTALAEQFQEDPGRFTTEELTEEAVETAGRIALLGPLGAAAITPSVSVSVPRSVQTGQQFARGNLGPETSVDRLEIPREQAEGLGFGEEIDQPQQARLQELERGEDFVERRTIELEEDTVGVERRRAETISRTQFLKERLGNTRKGEFPRVTGRNVETDPTADLETGTGPDIEALFEEEFQSGTVTSLDVGVRADAAPTVTPDIEEGLSEQQVSTPREELETDLVEQQEFEEVFETGQREVVAESLTTAQEPLLEQETRIDAFPGIRTASREATATGTPDSGEDEDDESLLELLKPSQELDLERSVGADILGFETGRTATEAEREVEELGFTREQNPLSLRGFRR